MKKNNPRRYKIEGLGEWGVAEGLVYENWEVKDFDALAMMDITDRRDEPVYMQLYGLDFGYSVDPSSFISVLANPVTQEIYIYDEIYKRGLTNQDLAQEIIRKGYGNVRITADSAEPKSIEELRRQGLRVFPAKKGADSVRAGIHKIQDYKIIVHPRCKNTIAELGRYCWATNASGEPTNKPVDADNHAMDAFRYAVERLNASNFSW